MSDTFYARNGYTFTRNLEGGRYLSKITLGVFKKIGCHPKRKEDCKLVARILRNRANLNQWWRPYFEEAYCMEKMDEEDVKWNISLANFFEFSGGCMDMDEFYEMYPNGGKNWRFSA